jgi:IS30 family transposase
MKVALDPFLARYVEERLRSYWSPERIAGRLQREHHRSVSAKAIRKFAYSRRLESFLYRKGRKKKETYAIPITWQEDRVFVDDPACIRTGYGHWELDFLVSAQSTAVLLVAVERITRHTIIRWLPHRNNDLVREVVVAALSPFSLQSVTVDNDIAFVKHRELSAALHAPVYFTRPYCSTDKALVENTNRWIRWFIKKKTDLRLVTLERVQWIEDWLTSVPRQCLDFATTREMLVLEELNLSARCSY